MSFFRVKTWSADKIGHLVIDYFTWDGKCLCTAEHFTATIPAIHDVSSLDKKDVHLLLIDHLKK